MEIWALLTGGCALVCVLLLVRALQILRQEKDAPRGVLPDQGSTTIEAHYISGGGGGGHHSTYQVPRDPQEYARLFVPKEAKSKENTHD